MSEAPSPFSATNPKLQVAWDATSLRSLMTCPRQYQLYITEGWRPTQDRIDLDFGGFFASSVERYKKARTQGLSKVDATLIAVRYAVEASWSEAGPWGGRYEELWHCTGTTKYRNAKGNAAKCPFSHKGAWFPTPGPATCSCGSPTASERQWISNDRTKDRYTLIRLVVWYCQDQPESMEEGAYPYVFPNGQPAVELSFKLPLPWKVPGSTESYLLCGHLDNLTKYGQEVLVGDNKTTRNAIGKGYFSHFHPNIQMDTYDLAATTLYPSLNIKGVMIEAAQTLVDGAKFGVGITYRSDAQREEFLGDLRYWLDQAEKFAEDDYWPMNRANCYLCPFKGICSKDPDMRQKYLEAEFVRDPWNPLQER